MTKIFSKHRMMSCALALSLCVTATNYSCTQQQAQQWLSTVGQYLPVAIQVAQSVASLVVMFGGAKATDDQLAVQNISAEATRDFNLIQTLYDKYKQSPSDSTQAAIENALHAIVSDLPDELTAAHIKDAGLLQKVTASVNIMVAVADIVISQMPVKTPALKAYKGRMKAKASHMTPTAVKLEWDARVCNYAPSCTALVKGN